MPYNKVENPTIFYRYGFAVITALISVLVNAAFWDVTKQAPMMFMVGAVALSAWQGGLLPGMLTAALSILMVDYFLLEPRYAIFTSPTSILQFVLFGLIAGLISWLEEHRLQSERALREVKDELEVILNGVTEGITVQDQSGALVFANAASVKLTGQSSISTMLNTPMSQLQNGYKLLNDEDETMTYDAMPRHKVFNTGKPAELRFGVKEQESGEERWIMMRSAPIFDRKGDVRLAVNIFHDITERRRSEKQRLESEQRLRKVLDNLAAFVGVLTPDGILIEANRSALETANLKAEDVLGKPFDQTYWWSYDDEVQAELRRSIKRAAAGETVRYDVTVMVDTQRYITIDFLLAPVFNGKGKVEYLIPSGIDVTARNDLTNQLQVQQRRLETILNTVPGIVYEGSGGDDAGEQHYNFISKYAETMLGYPLADWKAASPSLWPQIVHPEDWDETIRLANETYKEGKPGPVPFRCITADGRIIHVEAYNNVITDLSGNQLGTCGIVLDVTERRHQEAEIKRLNSVIDYERQRLSTIISNVPGIVYEASGTRENGQQHMDYISAYAEKMLGYSPDEWHHDPEFMQKIVHPDDWEYTRKRTSAIFATGQPGTIQFRCNAKDGRVVHVEAHSGITLNPQGEPIGATGVMMDITERHRIEEAVAEYAEDLQRSNEELEQFAYVASHDLQEPLRMVSSYLQLIEQRYADRLDSDAIEFIAFAVDGATRMKRLINDLLAYSRIQRSQVAHELVSMETILEQVLYNLQLSIEDAGAVITHDPLPDLTANSVQMTQLLQNLVGNALKFKAERPLRVHIGVRKEQPFWHFTVHDNGIGIEADYLERIFVIFQRLHTRSQYSGTGIGLAICKKIVDKHGGEIFAESTPGEETTFHFKIPIVSRHRNHRRMSDGTHTNITSGR